MLTGGEDPVPETDMSRSQEQINVAIEHAGEIFNPDWLFHMVKQRQESMKIKLAGINLFSGEREHPVILVNIHTFKL
jgi:hypothetical protein